MNYQWGDGFHAPKGVSAEKVAAVVLAMPNPTPTALVAASKRKTHVLHGELWSESDKVWAERGRLDRAAKIIGAIYEVVVVGGKEISIRAVEFVRHDGEGRWAKLADIRADPELLDAYLAEVIRMQEQAMGKLIRVRE